MLQTCIVLIANLHATRSWSIWLKSHCKLNFKENHVLLFFSSPSCAAMPDSFIICLRLCKVYCMIARAAVLLCSNVGRSLLNPLLSTSYRCGQFLIRSEIVTCGKSGDTTRERSSFHCRSSASAIQSLRSSVQELEFKPDSSVLTSPLEPPMLPILPQRWSLLKDSASTTQRQGSWN